MVLRKESYIDPSPPVVSSRSLVYGLMTKSATKTVSLKESFFMYHSKELCTVPVPINERGVIEMPQVKVFAPCERVITRHNGATDLLGFGIHNMQLRKKREKEYAEGAIEFYCYISFTPGEEGRRTIQVSFISQDGEILSKSPNISLDIKKAGGLNIGGEFMLKARESGPHVLKLFINQDFHDEWPIRVIIKEID